MRKREKEGNEKCKLSLDDSSMCRASTIKCCCGIWIVNQRWKTEKEREKKTWLNIPSLARAHTHERRESNAFNCYWFRAFVCIWRCNWNLWTGTWKALSLCVELLLMVNQFECLYLGLLLNRVTKCVLKYHTQADRRRELKDYKMRQNKIKPFLFIYL